MEEITDDPRGVAKLFGGLHVNVPKASGPDGLNARVVKECNNEISLSAITFLHLKRWQIGFYGYIQLVISSG